MHLAFNVGFEEGKDMDFLVWISLDLGQEILKKCFWTYMIVAN